MYICLSDAIGFKISSHSGGNFTVSAAEPAKAASMQTLRSTRTRAALLEAAEKIFVRDGFEASRIEDIAAEAGRSRGAFYANFANKTEVFLALRSRAIQQKVSEIREILREAPDEEARYSAIGRHILEQICNPRSLVLQIEFKLFALRHPERLAELAAKHLEASTSVHRQELSDFFSDHDKTVENDHRKTLAIEALLEGFAINALFSPQVLTPAHLEELIPRLVGEILPPLSAS